MGASSRVSLLGRSVVILRLGVALLIWFIFVGWWSFLADFLVWWHYGPASTAVDWIGLKLGGSGVGWGYIRETYLLNIGEPVSKDTGAA